MLSNHCQTWSSCTSLKPSWIVFIFWLNAVAVTRGLPLAPSGSTDTRHAFTLTVQLGGKNAKATVDFLAVVEDVVSDELNCQPDACRIQDAWNVSICENGVPRPAPYASTAELGLLPSIAPLAAPSGSVGAADLGRRLLQMEPPAQVQQLEQDAQQAVVPSPYRPCVPQLDIVFKLVFADSVDEPKYNQTKLFFMTGAFLARMQARNIQLEQSLLLNFTDDEMQDPGEGAALPGGNGSDIFTLEQAIRNQEYTFVQFALLLIGDSAMVTNDTVLKAAYDMLVDANFNGGNGSWLTAPNTAIVEVKQGPRTRPDPPPGRRLLHHLIVRQQTAWPARKLLQMPSGAPAGSVEGNSPSIEVSFKAQNVRFADISVVKDAINSLVSGDRLVNGFRAKGIGIEKVSLTSFTFQSSIAPGGPALGVPLPPLVLPPRSSHKTMVVLVIAIVVPVCVVGAIIIGCSIVWWGRITQRKLGGYRQPAKSFESTTKSTHLNSEFSMEGLEMLPVHEGSLVGGHRPSTFSQSLMDLPWSDWKIEPSELTILTKPDGSKWLLGSGAAGTVYKALRNGVQIVAVKLFKDEVTRGAITSLNSAAHAAQFRQEISILKSCHDRNIVQFVGACLAEGQTSLVTEYLENGDLYRAINSPQGCRYHWYRLQSAEGRPLPNSGMARRVALDVARGLHFLHTRKIVHFDLKSANILLARDFTAKIADVGLAKILHDDVLSTRREVGTFAWAAPEILLGQRTTEAADIYSFGVLLHELSAQESPRDRHLRRLSVPDQVPLEVNDLINRCLDVQPANRPTARDLVASLSCMPVIPPFAPEQTRQPV